MATSTEMTTRPKLILGTMTIGPKGQTNEADATSMLLKFCNSNLVGQNPMIDTAIMYQNGDTEKTLGRIMQQHKFPKASLSIATKANPFTSGKNLSPSGVRGQLEESLKSLQLDELDIFYLHAPDVQNHIEPTLEEVQKLYSEGKFKKFALSNFMAWEVVYIHTYMSRRSGYVLPSIYQGMYNAITRKVESELLPALRKLDICFYAYNPLAGGMLSGKYTRMDKMEDTLQANAKVGGRFAGETFWAQRYRERFQQNEQFDAVELIKKALSDDNNQCNVSVAEASLRWLCHHSKLQQQDGIIVGASKLSHFDANMEALGSGILPEKVVKAFDEASRLCVDICPDYARGYSGSSLH